jgi:hypothetical protein
VSDATRVDPLRNYDSFQQSLRDFHSWLGPVVSGACDVDFLCERNGAFLFIEAKPYYNGIQFGYGQHLLLYRLAKQPNTTVWLVGEAKDCLYLVDYSTPIPPKFFRLKGKAQVKWEPHVCRQASKEELKEEASRWWQEQEGRAA